MNWDNVQGKWKQYVGQAKEQWGKLTDDEVLEINGNREVLSGKIQDRYGVAKEDANKQIDDWAKRLKV
ncbi:MAG: CsbD family protein [Phototrophicaceae bacterium]|jgi:uncharacterized protein YjbJ (UPF0337 family)